MVVMEIHSLQQRIGTHDPTRFVAGYDDGDCCEASCVSTSFRCGEFAPYNCLDPDHNGEPATSYSYKFSCEDDLAGNGHCDSVNNNEECGMSVDLDIYIYIYIMLYLASIRSGATVSANVRTVQIKNLFMYGAYNMRQMLYDHKVQHRFEHSTQRPGMDGTTVGMYLAQ